MGGVGFLFPDTNEFVNPAQMALVKGGTAQAYYTHDDQTNTQSLTPSVVLGNGKWGGGAFARRSGNNFSDSEATDRVGVALGMGFAADRVTLGAVYDREVSRGQIDDGTAGVSMNFNGRGRLGFSVGAKATTTVNALSTRRTATMGAGYAFSARTNAELYYTMNNLDDSSDTAWGGALSTGVKNIYLSGGYSVLKNTTVGNAGSLSARAGMQFNAVDFSAHAEKVMKAGYSWTYGGTLRLSF